MNLRQRECHDCQHEIHRHLPFRGKSDALSFYKRQSKACVLTAMFSSLTPRPIPRAKTRPGALPPPSKLTWNLRIDRWKTLPASPVVLGFHVDLWHRGLCFAEATPWDGFTPPHRHTASATLSGWMWWRAGPRGRMHGAATQGGTTRCGLGRTPIPRRWLGLANPARVETNNDQLF